MRHNCIVSADLTFELLSVLIPGGYYIPVWAFSGMHRAECPYAGSSASFTSLRPPQLSSSGHLFLLVSS